MLIYLLRPMLTKITRGLVFQMQQHLQFSQQLISQNYILQANWYLAVISAKPLTSINPMSNAILERIHQVLGNLVRTLTYKKPTLPKMTRGRAFCMQQRLQFPQQPVGKNIIVREN